MPASTVNSFPVMFAVLLALGVPVTALAWGSEGHEIVGRIAELRLKREALTGLNTLLGSPANAKPHVPLADMSNWADEVRRGRPETAPWHFVDIPFAAERYEPGRDCNGNHKGCVIEAIRDQARLIGDREAGNTERVEALKFLVHFVIRHVDQISVVVDTQVLLKNGHEHAHAIENFGVLVFLRSLLESVPISAGLKSDPSSPRVD